MSAKRTVDVGIVGGGIVGLSLAWRLKALGLQVAVFDAGAIAAEASSAGAGMLAPGGEVHAESGWARDTVSALSEYRAFVAELEQASGTEIDYRACGGLDLAFDDSRWMELRARKLVQEQLGIRVSEISAAEAREMVPSLSDRSFRALWCPEDAIVDPRHVTGALVSILHGEDVELIPGQRIAQCERSGSLVRLRDDRGSICAEVRAVVIAAGAWSTEIGVDGLLEGPTEAPRRAVPVRGHLIRAAREPGILGPIVRGGELYVFQRNSGDVIAGSNEEHVGFSRELNLTAVHRLHHLAQTLIPDLVPQIESAWLGFRPGIEGDGPEVRRVGESALWLAYGHYRNGILLAPHTAKHLAREVRAALD